MTTRRWTVSDGSGVTLIASGVISGGLLFVSGQPAFNPLTETAPDGGIAVQARAAMARVQAVVEAAGATLTDAVRIECFLVNRDDFPVWNDVFREYFPTDPPARTTLITGLPLESMLIEVQAVVAMPSP